MSKTGRIYKIVHNQSNVCYVGSTFNNLRDRWHHHKADFNQYLKGKHSELAIYPYFKEQYEVVDRQHFAVNEQLWIDKLKSINKQPTFRIKKLTQKHYRELNKKSISQYKKQYRKANKQHINEYKKDYYQLNKESFNEKRKSEHFECDCGFKIRKSDKSQHIKTKTHQEYLQSL
ncbi:TPA: hypothetical protein N0F65_004864 [Lagenidium giganteum]|uniref:GIY-YIG domain-containing protein n=1 Tax=Lagenidium giganteum TaxID=4803 RepID=A0AAV2Z7Y6_9STRA|nr:TPA: hypothetical protein N0F65_004864 [Lagenidium giganteum]